MATGGGYVAAVGGFRPRPAGLGSASEVRRVRGGISYGAACGLESEGVSKEQSLQQRATVRHPLPPSPPASAKREMLMWWARHSQVQDSGCGLVFLLLKSP